MPRGRLNLNDGIEAKYSGVAIFMRSRLTFLFILFVFSLAANHGVISQTITEHGNLLVKTGLENRLQVLADVQLSIIARDGNATRVRTNEKGEARIGNLSPGLYELRAQKSGYLRIQEPSVRITPGKTTELKLQLSALPNSLEETLVVARARPAQLEEGIAFRRKDREALRSAPGSGSDVLRALDGLPGLVSTGDFASFTVRGRGPKDNLILVDGIPFENVVHFNQSLGESEDIAGGGRYSIFAPNLIEGADFQPGGWSARYAGRSGSLLNLQVAEASLDSARLSTRLDVAGLEVTYEGPSAVYDNTSLLFSARQLDFGRFFKSIGIEDIGSPKLTDVILKTNTGVNAHNTFNLLLIHAPETYVRDMDNVLAGDDGIISDYSLAEAEQDNDLFSLTWESAVGDNSKLNQKLYYRRTDKTSAEGEAFLDNLPPDVSPEEVPRRERIITLEEENRELGYRLDYAQFNRWGEFRGGLEITNIDLRYQTTLQDDWIRFTYDLRDAVANPTQRYIVLEPENVNAAFSNQTQNYGLYGEHIINWGDWQARGGMRYDRNALSSENLLSPRFGLTWFVLPDFSLAATAGYYYQAPLFLDRARSQDNNELESEKTTQYSFGFNWQVTENWNLLSEMYVQKLDQLVTPPARTSGFMSNAGSGESYGFDLVANKTFAESWSLNISYSFNKATVNMQDGLGERDADFHRPHVFSIGGVWEINDRWKLSSRWKYLDGMPTDAYVIYEDVLAPDGPLRFSQAYTQINSEREDAYHTLNFRVDYRRSLAFADVVAFLDVINALGNVNPGAQDFDSRTGRFGEEDGDIFPLIGFRLEF